MPYLVLDLEMTGPEPGWNEIVQVGACLYDDDWKEHGQFLSNVYPENEDSFSDYSEEVHGLSIDELDEAPMLHEVLDDFENWILEKLNRKKMLNSGIPKYQLFRDIIICGQSVIYDIDFMRFAYKKENLEWAYSNKLIDLHTLSYFYFMILEKNRMKTPSRLDLNSIAAFFGFHRENTLHNALEDAMITARCLKKIFLATDKLKVIEPD